MKQYLLVSLPKRESDSVALNEAKIFSEYEEAFEAFNNAIAEWGQQEFKYPRHEKPLRAALPYEVIELWIFNRAENIVLS